MTFIKNFRAQQLLFLGLALMLAMFSTSCKKDDDDIPKPVIGYIVEYRVNSVSDVTIDEITYLDEDGREMVIPGQREFILNFRANSGRKLAISTTGNIEHGYVEVSINAYSAGRPTETKVDNLGFTGTGTQDFDLSVDLELP